MNDAAFQLADRWAVVTGSTRGIGKAIALELAAAGANVVVHGRNASAAEEVCAAIRKLKREAVAIVTDIATPHARTALVEQAWRDHPVDVWVNNAGFDVLTGAAADWPFAEKLQRLWELDVQGTIELSRNVGDRMRQRGHGAIINIGWDQAEIGMAGDSGEMFAAVKGAVMAFTRSLARSLAPQVRVNCIAPGWIRTAWGDDASAYWQERAVNESLLHRWGEVEDVARVARFIASPAASFVTGQIIYVNGGRAS
ncbi:MAG: SDR family oxidoreductase [Pirellulales bacterium]|nr:SDR family oxidoreductase [Pirellulales bacterium]